MRDRKNFRIEVVLSLFSDRKNYQKEILSKLTELAEGPSIIFLDPDTGLAPANPGYEHVLNDELAGIWAAMRFSDVLAIYQHQTNRRGEPWIQAKRSQMEAALKLPPGTVRVVAAEDPEQRRAGAAAPKDIALLFCHKTRA